ncbi:hypothetical protein MNBD_BACTEROID05-892 [hydrothermal vent metagenome]|uniref:Uncharacterized protein n=1 Tax=hydrothermal vent metagenome TaxID=652676 RepID=A0A3B0T1J8_9ZZZZ
MKMFKRLSVFLLVVLAGVYGYRQIWTIVHEKEILRQVIGRLQADSRVAEVLVTGVNYDEQQKKKITTIKYLEYDIDGKPMLPKYFSFSGNIIQFQSLVIRFDDNLIKKNDPLRGRSAYLFWKVFLLDGAKTQEYEITPMYQIPQGYKVQGLNDSFEESLWKEFWSFALDPQKAGQQGIKSAQIEAPGTMFIPGVLYTIKIEHDGGLRIDSSALSPILRGEKILR